MDISTIAYTVSVWAIPVLLAVTFHEGRTDGRRGAWATYRLSPGAGHIQSVPPHRPVRHHPVADHAAAGVGRAHDVGFAKPVPVNFRGLARPRRDMVLVAIAGPGINLLLAIVAAALVHTLPLTSGAFREWYGLNLQAAVWINLLLAVFNMLPLPPLDGGRVAVGLLPWRLAVRLARLERAGIPIILAVVFVVPWLGDAMGMDLNVFWWLVGMPTSFLEAAIFRLVGLQ